MKSFFTELRKEKVLFLMATPAILLTILINYIPMAGIVLAFKSFKYNLGLFGSPWSGWTNFRFFFMSGTAWNVTANTVLYNIINLISTQILAIVIAILLSEIIGKYFRKFAQSAIFLPHFISWIFVGLFSYGLFNYEGGLLNGMLKSFGIEPINVYGTPSAWWFIIPIINAWKSVGYTSVIYIAAITGIDMECYESADIDGANIFQKILYITMPSIVPTIIIMTLLSVGQILRGNFQMFFQLVGYNGQLFEATDVIDTFVFRSLITSGDLGMSSAATFYQSVLCFVIILLVNGLVRKIEPDYALF